MLVDYFIYPGVRARAAAELGGAGRQVAHDRVRDAREAGPGIHPEP